jgi:adenosylhomocysteine nucleosidase
VTPPTGGPGIIVGLAAEERLLRRAWPGAAPAVRCAGASAERAERLARALVAAGVGGLVSLGLAGGLDPALASGTLVLGDRVVLPEGGAVAGDAAWMDRLARRLGPGFRTVEAPVAGSDRPVASASEKAAVRESSGAAAADMESHGVARAARASGVPLLVLRVIADPAGQSLPRAALSALGPDGSVRAGAVLAALLRRPRHAGDLLRLARQSAAAMAVLGRAVRLAGPGLGLV